MCGAKVVARHDLPVVMSVCMMDVDVDVAVAAKVVPPNQRACRTQSSNHLSYDCIRN